MQDINSVTVVGRLTRDVEVKSVGGTELAELSIASNYSTKRGLEWVEEVSFFDVVKWEPGGVKPYLVKGTQIAVEGTIRQERWEKDGQKRSRVKIHAKTIQLLGSKGEGGKQRMSGPPEYGTQPGDVGYSEGAGFSDDVPF